MADNVAVTAGSGTTIAADEVVDGTLGTVKVQYVKLMDGTLDGTSKATVNATGLKVDASGAAVPVTDNSGSLTVDAPVATPVYVRLSDGAAAISTLPVSLSSVPSHAVTVASGGVASGAIASGAVASGAFASGALASGSVASGAFASGSIAAGAVAAGASSFVKLEDVASADADAGVPAMAVRKATPANTSGTDGDYEMLQMSAGRLWTNTLLGDGTNAVAVKAASTSAAATDPSLVVQLSPQNMPFLDTSVFVSGVSANMTGTTSTSCVAAPGASLRNYITSITVTNSHATVGTDVLIQDGSGGTTLWRIPAAAVYGGATIVFPTPLRQPTTNTAIYVQNVTTGASTYVSIAGYKAA